LDLFKGPGGPQNHDFNPGIDKRGLFWTIAIPDSAVTVDFAGRTASMHLRDQDLEDYHDVVNALMDGPSVPATCSFHIQWSGQQSVQQIRDKNQRFEGTFVQDESSVSWRAETRTFSFDSDPAKSSSNEFSVLARERNGVFF
jgi:hypothetical protein